MKIRVSLVRPRSSAPFINRNMYTVIEDASPYFIRFTFDTLVETIDHIKKLRPKFNENHSNYFHRTFDEVTGRDILSRLPMFDQFDWIEDRVSIFSTHPGHSSSIHKDGELTKVSFNIPLMILDRNCITRWYTDETFNDVEPSGLPYTRIVVASDRKGYGHIPAVKEMTAVPNEMILFNTDIYHSWENKSKHVREVLTLRIEEDKNLSFLDVRKILFGY